MRDLLIIEMRMLLICSYAADASNGIINSPFSSRRIVSITFCEACLLSNSYSSSLDIFTGSTTSYLPPKSTRPSLFKNSSYAFWCISLKILIFSSARAEAPSIPLASLPLSYISIVSFLVSWEPLVWSLPSS